MIAEVLLVLAGHSSSLFPIDYNLNPAFAPLLHPGEKQCLESLARIAFRYRRIKQSCSILAQSPSRYICAVCATLNQILRDEYEALIIDTEAKVLARDPSLVARGSFVPLSSIRATFAEWDAPLTALESLMDTLEKESTWKPGPLIDLLLERAQTGIYRISTILSRLAQAVQRVWCSQLAVFIVHGTLSPSEPLASPSYSLLDGSIPSCVPLHTRDSIAYIGRAIGTVKDAKWQNQLPRKLTTEHTKMLESVLPEDQYAFSAIIGDIRTNVSEWLWLNVLTQRDVEDAVESLANYFLLRNGEFGLSLIREIERLKLSRLTARAAQSMVIKELDLNLALLRASMGTTAQHDPSLSQLRFLLPKGPLRPFLPSLVPPKNAFASLPTDSPTNFDDLLLGTPLTLTYIVNWPLDLFLHPADLQAYSALFSYISSLRKTHTRIHTCWTSLSNAQRARRRWTGLGEGGTQEDLRSRQELLRCGWGVVREMSWFLDVLLGYLMVDVVDVEFGKLKALLRPKAADEAARKNSLAPPVAEGQQSLADTIAQPSQPTPFTATSHSTISGTSSSNSHLDFTTLRHLHSKYLEHLLTGSLLSNFGLTSIVRSILEVCEHFTAQVERWGGDVLPALLFEGSLATTSEDSVGKMVKERWVIVAEINETLHGLLESFYEQLSLSTQPFSAQHDSASKSMLMSMNASATGFYSQPFIRAKGNKMESDGERQRHVERLLLRLDFSGGFSAPKSRSPVEVNDILKQGGL